ncbi:MAG: hypothetical protein H0V48_07190 [Nocardioidaceae bacterium]|nr:hypothetical protein [Nocardioidaceae bacterium]
MRIAVVIVVVWLLVGVVAAVQRDYFSSNDKINCADVGTTALTVVAGPLNYVGANPKTKCDAPEPSR